MQRRNWVIELITQIVGNEQTAIMVVDRLTEENLLHLGYGDADIDLVVDNFKEVFGNTRTTKSDRYAARRLTTKHGSQSVIGIIRLLGSLSENKYAPVVGSVAQLEDKWVAVLSFIRKQSDKQVIDV